MLSIADAPKHVKPFAFHGVVLNLADGSDQARGECPLCGKAGKFHVALADGQWDCKVCGQKGNPYTFLRALWEKSLAAGGDYAELAADRGLLYPDTLMEWGVARSYLTGEWLVPGWNQDGKLNQLYRYCVGEKGARLYATPSMNHGIHCPIPNGEGLVPKAKTHVAVLEGPWDGMALYEVAKRARPGAEGTYQLTAAEAASLYAKTAVLAVPGCNVFPDVWARPMADRHVWFGYDNDHPKPHPQTGVVQAPVGFDGTRRACLALAAAEGKPASVRYLNWGENGWSPNYPDGFDVRDYMKLGETVSDRVRALGGLLANLAPIPDDWVPGRSKEAKATGGVDLEPLHCTNYRTVQTAMKKALKYHYGLDKGLQVMFAVIASTTGQGSQLWARVVGPPSCGKTTLCEAVSVAKKHVKAMSHLTGFFSGVKDKERPDEDQGLIAKLMNMTLVTKDGDTLLQSDNLGRILGEARDIYDRAARTHFKTGTGRDYGSVNMTWILCGTGSLRALDTSELGERFVTCVMMKGVDPELEDEVQWRLINRVNRTRGLEANGKAETQHPPEMIQFMRLAGGYVEHLRANSSALQEAVVMDDDRMREICALAKFVAYMRARPSKTQDEVVEREFGARLTEQFGRLAICLAAVTNKTSVDEDVMRVVRECALDTGSGITYNLCYAVHRAGPAGLDPKSLSNMFSAETPHKLADTVRFMRKIGMLETFTRKVGGVSSRVMYRLTDVIQKLWEKCVPPDAPAAEEDTDTVVPPMSGHPMEA